MAAVYMHTNLCMMHVAGCCPHLECRFCHDDKSSNLLQKYVKAANKGLPKDIQKIYPSDLTDVKNWRNIYYDLFAFYTGSGISDFHGAVKSAYLNQKANPELVTRAARILRHIVTKHADPYDEGVRNAVFIIFDWHSPRFQSDTNRNKTNARFVELQTQWNDCVKYYL